MLGQTGQGKDARSVGINTLPPIHARYAARGRVPAKGVDVQRAGDGRPLVGGLDRQPLCLQKKYRTAKYNGPRRVHFRGRRTMVINYTFVAIGVWLTCAGTCAVIAHDKNRSDFGWFLLGLMFSLFALVAICAISRRNKPPASEPLDSSHLAKGSMRVEPEPVWRTEQPQPGYGKSWNSM